jgi:hypothetical protein
MYREHQPGSVADLQLRDPVHRQRSEKRAGCVDNLLKDNKSRFFSANRNLSTLSRG